MSGKSKAISEKLYSEVTKALVECGRQGDVSRKLQAIKSAKENGVSIVAKIYGVSRLTIMNWIKAFEEKGVDGLKIQEGRGRSSIINDREQEIIRGWMEADNAITIKEVRLRIEEEMGKKIGKSAVHNMMRKLEFSYITPRPKHYKQVAEKQVEFKKKSEREDGS